MAINFSGGINVSVNASMSLTTGVNVGMSAGVNANLSVPAPTAPKKTPGDRKDPFMAFKFRIEIDGITAGGFTEISGLGMQTDYDKKNFGGENDIEYKFIKATKYNDVTLKHGLIDLDLLWGWYQEVVGGKISWRNATIYLRDSALNDIEGWHMLAACPIKWDGPTFNASNSTVATETLTLTYHKLVR